MGALESLIDEQPAPLSQEFSLMIRKVKLGVNFDDAYCFGAYPAYPDITELTAFIKSKRTNVDIVVKNNVIRVTSIEK